MNLAVTAARKGYAKGPCTLAWTSSESGEPSAGLLRLAARNAEAPWP